MHKFNKNDRIQGVRLKLIKLDNFESLVDIVLGLKSLMLSKNLK